MEETTQYHQCSKDDLREIIMDRDRTIADRDQAIADLKKEVEALKHPVRKNSTNSSIPSSKELIPPTRSQREKSGKKPGGQLGHVGHHRDRNPHPNRIVLVQATHCGRCGGSLDGREGTIGQRAQQVDIPPIIPVTTQYQQVIKVCACGECNQVPLPTLGSVTIGPEMAAVITYFTVEHALASGRLTQIAHDVLGFPLSEGTVANKLKHMLRQAKGIIQAIKGKVMAAPWTGSDETSTPVAGKRWWEWVWQCPQASYAGE